MGCTIAAWTNLLLLPPFSLCQTQPGEPSGQH
ncbi:hypothetical protein POX_h09770 [Penicillium oxalicum]|nr:hypothetical protein POX_h09770 [Penicillium oxalicum]KAI2786005.1 hypothetical protein POX_h09770 [Penicillium oxalicum]